MDNKIVLIHQSEVDKKKRFNTDKYQFYKREITKRSDFSQAYICIYDIPPLKAAYPMHYHEANTEAFYIIEGNGVVKTLTNDLIIKKGDVIVFPPGKEGAHQIMNTSNSETLTYIDFDTTNSPDICRYPNSDKVGIIIHNTSSEFYKASDQTDYYEGE